MSLKKFLSQSTHKKISKDLDENFQIKAFFFLYSLFSIVPSVDYYCFKGIKISRIKEEGDFLLHLTLNDRSSLDLFFLNLLVYNGDFLFATKQFKDLFSFVGNRDWSFNTVVSGKFWGESFEFLHRSSQIANLSRLELSINLIFKSFLCNKNVYNLVRNILYL